MSTEGTTVTSADAGSGSATAASLGFLEDGEADFVAVYHAWYPAMVRLAVLIVSDRQEAEEVAQDAFVAAYRRWGRIATPVPYIRRSVVNRGRDVLRRRRLASALRLRPAHDTEPAPTEPVDDLLATLPPRQRAAVVLRFYEDLTVDEIATTLHARPGTVKSLLHRALARLREEIER